MSKFKNCIWFIVAMVISFLPGIFGVFFTPHGESDVWYMALARPGLTPPGWVFGAAWTLWYIMLGIALYLVIKNRRSFSEKRIAYTLFGVQLVLNGLWSYLFFGAHLIGFALLCLMLLLIASIWMARAFHAINRWAGYAIIPYILWMMFAFYLNSYILLMN